MRALVVGCGYVGLALARELVAQGHEVIGVRRDPGAAAALSEAGIQPWIADVSQADAALPEGRFDWIIYCASAGRETSADAYRRTYVDAQRTLIARYSQEGFRPAKWIYTGSTSVYGQQDGSTVKETSLTEPRTETAKILLEAERLLVEAARAKFPAIVLRVAGIYGPARLPLMEKFLANQVRVLSPGTRAMNMIHRDDVVGSILAALRNGRPGECYNVVDQEPVTEMHFYTWMAETLGKWVPRLHPDDDGPEAARERLDRKVSNRRLTMELGYRLKYANFRLGYTAEIKQLTDAGLLEVAPENRG